MAPRDSLARRRPHARRDDVAARGPCFESLERRLLLSYSYQGEATLDIHWSLAQVRGHSADNLTMLGILLALITLLLAFVLH